MVSQEAKDLVRMMLTVEPANRATINQILENRWLSEYNSVLQAPLNTPQVLAEEALQRPAVTVAIINANGDNRLEDTDADAVLGGSGVTDVDELAVTSPL
ncbi:unnamed protein product [Didymodactylos carnosus]|uniref:Uncharacterized protein n=1 Tax=Didymodactylos carnosus TaxID=1234261 RepID=A0A815NCB0_9BILA|nr:unnamed protein product [Didymodactylos carnosus]CAF4314758.1 unnamed protein product [Didymodactylos carnosus]